MSKGCTQDLPVVTTNSSSTGTGGQDVELDFCFPTIRPFQKYFFKDYFFTVLVDFGVPFRFTSSRPRHFEASEKLWNKTPCSEFRLVSVVRRLEISKHVRDLIILHNNFIRNVVSYSNFERSQKCHCYQLHWYTLFEKCLWRCLINSGLKSPALGSRF